MEMENEIYYMSRPLGQALSSFSRNKRGRMTLFSKRVSEILSLQELTIETAWKKSVGEFQHQWILHRDEWNLLFSVGEMLGKTDRENQSSFLRMMREKFVIQEKRADEDRARKEKLYKNLGALGGLAIVLVLI